MTPAAVIATEKENTQESSSQRGRGSDPSVVVKHLKRVGGAGVRKGESTCKVTKSQEIPDST